MPQLTLHPEENGYIWITLGGQQLVPLRAGDDEGLKVITTALVAGGAMMPRKQR